MRRPTKYNEELARLIAATVSSTPTRLAELCEQNKAWPTKATIKEWMYANEEFAMCMVKAVEIRDGVCLI